jgi:hypothetical protein
MEDFTVDASQQRLSLEALLRRLEDLGVAMRSYADSLLEPCNGELTKATGVREERVKDGD